MACRRSREYELRRLQRALEDVEGHMRRVRLGWGMFKPDTMPKLEAERVTLEQRLRDLLDDDEDAR